MLSPDADTRAEAGAAGGRRDSSGRRRGRFRAGGTSGCPSERIRTGQAGTAHSTYRDCAGRGAGDAAGIVGRSSSGRAQPREAGGSRKQEHMMVNRKPAGVEVRHLYRNLERPLRCETRAGKPRRSDCCGSRWCSSRDLAYGQLTLRATGLVFTTLLSLVPLLALSFSVLKAFGVLQPDRSDTARVPRPAGREKRGRKQVARSSSSRT